MYETTMFGSGSIHGNVTFSFRKKQQQGPNIFIRELRTSYVYVALALSAQHKQQQ